MRTGFFRYSFALMVALAGGVVSSPAQAAPIDTFACKQQGGLCQTAACSASGKTDIGECTISGGATGLHCCQLANVGNQDSCTALNQPCTLPSPGSGQGACMEGKLLNEFGEQKFYLCMPLDGTGGTGTGNAGGTGGTGGTIPNAGGGTGTIPNATGGTGGVIPNATGPQSIAFTNPLKYDTVEGVLTSLLGTLRAIIVVLALIFLIIGAILYITSAGDDKRMTTAKAAITASMIGLALGIAAPSFLKEIGTILGWGPVNNAEVASALTLSQIARNVLNFLLSIVGILAVIMLVVGGLTYLTAAGDEDRIDTGKKIVKYSIIGILVALASMVIVNQIANFFA